MTAEPKDEALLVRMGKSELAMLVEMSEQSGLTKADVIRQLIRREYEAPKSKRRVSR